MNVLETYLLNPNKCLYCYNLILPKVGQNIQHVKIKKYCNNSCSAKVNNKLYQKKPSVFLQCRECKTNFKRTKGLSVYCTTCSKSRSPFRHDSLTKEQAGRKYIRKNAARKAYKHFPKQCEICLYAKHVEVCHIKPVKDFSKNSLVSEINIVNNLVILCPNHHKELDYKTLDATSLQSILNRRL